MGRIVHFRVSGFFVLLHGKKRRKKETHNTVILEKITMFVTVKAVDSTIITY